MSTDLITFLNYISNWENESDEHVHRLIEEQRLFVKLGDFESDSVVDNEFQTLVDLAKEVRDETIAADAAQMAADAAAVAAFWSFGLSMAAFAVLEATELILKAVISSKNKDLSAKMHTIDTDISSKVNSNVNDYVIKYKANNNLIADQAPKGLDLHESRAILMQFMSRVDRKYKKKGGLTVANFKQLAASARVVYNSNEIKKVYDALDELNLSDKAKPDVQKFADTLKTLGFDKPWEIQLVQGLSLAIAGYKMKIANDTIKECADAAGLPLEEVESSAFGMMDMLGKFAGAVAIVMSVIDVVLSIIDIVDVVKQTNKMVDELENTVKLKYKRYFDGMRDASKAYNKAISEN